MLSLQAAVTDGCERSTGNLLYTVATKFPSNALVHRLNHINLLLTMGDSETVVSQTSAVKEHPPVLYFTSDFGDVSGNVTTTVNGDVLLIKVMDFLWS
ncbi:hypothetical protein L2E82_25604 [Cichorium intybus]|uniref:Uncharacterized protein n=1 Tax=Cichorium intybus TaxID=13427 RepID=A0ACB9E3J8_CICIN|nr:hypothetical protein L2E82_25604 [Cichorium intybus]